LIEPPLQLVISTEGAHLRRSGEIPALLERYSVWRGGAMRRKDWVRTKGTVSNKMLRVQGRGNLFTITFVYEVDGHFYSGEFVTHKYRYEKGRTVLLRYNPANPEENDLNGRGAWSLWLAWASYAGVAAYISYLLVSRGCR
jgi:hypothetical protein